MATENGFVSLDEFKTWADAADAADTALEPIPQDWIEETQAEITDEEIEKQQRELAAKMEKLVQLQKSKVDKVTGKIKEDLKELDTQIAQIQEKITALEVEKKEKVDIRLQKQAELNKIVFKTTTKGSKKANAANQVVKAPEIHKTGIYVTVRYSKETVTTVCIFQPELPKEQIRQLELGRIDLVKKYCEDVAGPGTVFSTKYGTQMHLCCVTDGKFLQSYTASCKPDDKINEEPDKVATKPRIAFCTKQHAHNLDEGEAPCHFAHLWTPMETAKMMREHNCSLAHIQTRLPTFSGMNLFFFPTIAIADNDVSTMYPNVNGWRIPNETVGKINSFTELNAKFATAIRSAQYQNDQY